jgi:predicted HAD superfamily phosphohydrolase YqeG
VDPYFVDKPNPLMMRSALRAIDAHSDTTVMIGDRMDTDIVAGLEAGLETVLVLSCIGLDGTRGGAMRRRKGEEVQGWSGEVVLIEAVEAGAEVSCGCVCAGRWR